MERLKALKNQLLSCVEGQMSHLSETDTEELGQAVDMIKDLEEAMYYCSIVKAMEKAEKQEELMGPAAGEVSRRYYSRYLPEVYMPMDYERDMDRGMGRMYYSERQPRNSQGEFMSYGSDRGGRRMYGGEGGGNGSGNEGSSSSSSSSGSGNSGGMSYYSEREFPLEFHDRREGRSPVSRRMYMESKELHKDKEAKMKDLEKYMKELGEDIVEMIEGASPEEKQILEKKLANLTSKVAQLNV